MARQSRDELATSMPHMGERGRIAEEIIKGILTRILPKRFSIGTGVIIAANGEASPQIDIVIYDIFHNAPLLSEFGACLFPVETVYATIEVKSLLNKAEFEKSLAAIRTIRKLGEQRHYIVPNLVVEGDRVVPKEPVPKTRDVPPRNYVLAFAQDGFGKTFADFKQRLSAILGNPETFIHGVCILKDDWFAGRVAHKPASELYGWGKDGLMRFYTSLLKGQRNYTIHPIDLNAYLPDDDGATIPRANLDFRLFCSYGIIREDHLGRTQTPRQSRQAWDGFC
ncbi:DUF6602 domain-containing protein [Bradyrhizobium jicamae]|uniref:DUF6602 domain-containing protein n=1 Tax=Bradyrhizobium jicamae TaxID=280332 RepID=UPI001BA92795|nr:DUF6602 domain-containing protein [Bradyrhizobium jicamae]MBR0938804.1 hypothetical protein [Bradyrhizobium jicamae]